MHCKNMICGTEHILVGRVYCMLLRGPVLQFTAETRMISTRDDPAFPGEGLQTDSSSLNMYPGQPHHISHEVHNAGALTHIRCTILYTE